MPYKVSGTKIDPARRGGYESFMGGLTKEQKIANGEERRYLNPAYPSARRTKRAEVKSQVQLGETKLTDKQRRRFGNTTPTGSYERHLHNWYALQMAQHCDSLIY